MTLAVLGLAALITTMLCAFALPSIHGGPHRVPIGVTGSQQRAETLQKNVDGDAWDVRLYETPATVKAAITDREIAGGLAVTAHSVDVYLATAGGPSAAGALTALADNIAGQHNTHAVVHDVVPFTKDDPRGGGLTAALLPMIFGGIFPALILGNLFRGHRGLRTRLAGVLLFSVVGGAAVAAFLQFVTHSTDGEYWRVALGLALGLAALSTTVLGLKSVLGMGGLALGGGLLMLLGNPLACLATGPHWLPAGWATLGQLLPPGATGSLLRANAFFDGTGSAYPALILAAWVALGLALTLLADRRGNRATAPQPEGTPVMERITA
ncbi:hypothetical protein [Streptomyces sp. NPDC088725]|uniref:hypothetical protein n=1 Tax=Streptomyces sp. NPDC088725 TaxID=3365873 RepID=UPI0038227431